MNKQITVKQRRQAEARAQGAELLGKGRNSSYGQYQLACGHEQEIAYSSMQSGYFRCGTCLDQRRQAKAKAQGAVLIGKGRSKAYGLYHLACGHEQEIRYGHMQSGAFRCGTCLDERRQAEARAQGVVLLGKGHNSFYGLYQLACGHEQEICYGNMQIGNFRCGTCLDERRQAEARAQGAVLLGKGRNSWYGLYQLSCGHEQEIQYAHMQSGNFRCGTCLDQRRQEEARAQGAVLLGKGRNNKYGLYQLSCGHEQEIRYAHMQISSFQCSSCFDLETMAAEQELGLIPLGDTERRGRYDYKLYRRSCCGHEDYIRVDTVRNHTVGCPQCAKTGFDPSKPAELYSAWVAMQDGGFASVLGITNNSFETRYTKSDHKHMTLRYRRKFERGQDALDLERKLKHDYRHLLVRDRKTKLSIKGNTTNSTEIFEVDVLPLYYAEQDIAA